MYLLPIKFALRFLPLFRASLVPGLHGPGSIDLPSVREAFKMAARGSESRAGALRV